MRFYHGRRWVAISLPNLSFDQTSSDPAGVQMMKVTIGSLFSAEGWLELEAHESDLRGSRGIAIAGALMLFMGVLNFKNTVIFYFLFLQGYPLDLRILQQLHLYRTCAIPNILHFYFPCKTSRQVCWPDSSYIRC